MKPKFVKLKNDLNVIFINDNSTDLVMSSVNIAVGSNMEEQDISGIAHVCEHMLFHNKFKNHDITKELHKLGAHFNATTSYDKTNYYTISSKSDICTCIDMLYNIYINNTFTEEDLRKEKNIIMEEYKLSYNNINKLMVHELFKYLFGKEKSENLFVIGSPETIMNTTKENIVKYKKQYIPELTTIIFVGNFNNNIVLNTLKKTFELLPNNNQLAKKILNNTIKLQNDAGFFQYIPYPDGTNANTNCIILLVFKVPFNDDKNNYALEMINNMLNYFILFEKLRLDNGTTYSSKSSTLGLETEKFGFLIIDTQVDFRYLFPVVSTLINIVKDLKNKKIDQELIDRTVKKMSITSDLIYQDFRSHYNWYIQQATTTRNFSKFITPEQHITNCSKITPENIQTTSKKIFDIKHSYSMVVGPYFKQMNVLAKAFVDF